MKPLLLPLLIFFCLKSVSASTPDWRWAKSATGRQNDQPTSVITDGSGNIYVAGVYASDSITFGGFTLHNSSLGFQEIFLVKYDSTGTVLWAQSNGGDDDDKATSITTDANGNFYLTGYFYSTDITFGSFTLMNGGSGDIFIVKYDPSGTVVWAKKEGGPSLEIPFEIALDDSSHFILTGRFSSLTLTFGTTTLTQAGSMDVFVVKYDVSGNVIWAKSAGGGSNDEGYSTSIDVQGNILIAGYFNQTASFGTTQLISAGISDLFIAKYNAAGTMLWAKKAGGSGDDRANSVTTDEYGNSYVCGFFTSSSITFGTNTFTNTGSTNSFIVKYDINGNVIWAQQIDGDSKAEQVIVVGDQLYVCGMFNGDTLHYGATSLYLNGLSDFFLLNTDTSGISKFAMKQSADGNNTEAATSLSSDLNGNLYLVGYFNSDPISFGTSVLTNTGTSFDVFLARVGNIISGIHEAQHVTDFFVYPNPGNGMFKIKSNELIDRIEVFDFTGKNILKLTYLKSIAEKQIDLSDFSSGIYYLKINDDRITKKIIIR